MLFRSMGLYLRFLLIVRSRKLSPLHAEALNYVDAFVEQYPLHLYPVVAKALELAYLKNRLTRLVDGTVKVVEVAVGEGTLSARLFPKGVTITALDLNPYSLVKTLRFPHIGQAVVCDGLNPPLRPGAFDLLVAVNFLDHITDKESTITNWARRARLLLFTENTDRWATGWSIPYAARKIGLRRFANKYATKIGRTSMQQLEPLDSLTRRFGAVKGIDILEQISFMSERTFFYSTIFSLFMRCYGPPTPPRLKRLFLGPLRWCAIPMTKKLAEALIRLDGSENRRSDTFVVFLCESRDFEASDDDRDLVCPHCQGLLDDESCSICGLKFKTSDGMLFLLPEEFRFVAEEYSSERASEIAAEHL